MAFNWEQGLASFGESVARTAQVMGVEAMRASLEQDRMKLAQEYALNRENIGRQFEMEKQRADQDFRKPAQDAQIEANKAQVDKYRTDTDLAKANEARLQKGIDVARGGSGGDVLARSREAIASIEQGPEGYASIGPETTYKDGTKDKPYGRYQVMGKNIPQWTKEALGREMTPEEFVKDQKAQDAVFNHRFGSYLEKYGNPQDAASAWFSGRPLSKAGNDKDVLGTSVPGYVAKFNEKFGTSGAPAGDRSRAALVETGQFDKAAELDFRREQEQAKRDAPPDAARMAEWWRKATPEQRKAMSDVLDMQRERRATPSELVGYEPDPDRPGALRPIPGGPRDPDQVGRTEAAKEGAKIKTATDEQNKAAGFADRMTTSNALLSQLDKQGANAWQRIFDAAGGVGNLVKSEDYQKFEQAKRDFVNAVLRRESGAVISDAEFSNADKQYFPRPGDSADVMAQKAENRRLALQGMVRSAGPTYKPPEVSQTPSQMTAPKPPSVGDVMEGYRFKGGNPADRNSWEPIR